MAKDFEAQARVYDFSDVETALSVESIHALARSAAVLSSRKGLSKVEVVGEDGDDTFIEFREVGAGGHPAAIIACLTIADRAEEIRLVSLRAIAINPLSASVMFIPVRKWLPCLSNWEKFSHSVRDGLEPK